MASTFQRQARIRKITYIAMIIALFAVALFWRRAGGIGVEAQADSLGLREQSMGDVELTGSAIRLTLTGSRGLAVCALWSSAQEKQKRHEWNDLEMLVRSVTKLQPHFITPWLFQSWNLAYNVSVESDRVRDKYFYITRGIELLSQGERINKNHPDLRFTIGFYNQHKIGLSDELNMMRSLFQLSCMPPAERDPNSLRTRSSDGRTVVDMAKFADFCQRHPMFIRRLRETLRCETPDEVLEFLAGNQKIPSRYEEDTNAISVGEKSKLKPEDQQYPSVPPPFSEEEPKPTDTFDDTFDNFTVARAWYAYAQLPLPPPEPKPVMIVQYDRKKYKMPKAMASHIFRGYPARGQTYIAETLEKEGWFDRDGWLIANWFPDDKFPASTLDARDAIVGGSAEWAKRSWTRAHELWREIGLRNGLYKPREEMDNLNQKAELYRKTFGLTPVVWRDDLPPDLFTPELRESQDAHDQVYWYGRNREMTNFPHFYFVSQVEMEDEAIKARKAFHQADRLRKDGKRDQALAKYQEAFPLWRDILIKHGEFRANSVVQEDTYEIELKYLEGLREMRGRHFRALSLIPQLIGGSATQPLAFGGWAAHPFTVRSFPSPIGSPLAYTLPDGEQLIPDDAKRRVRQRMGLPDPLTPSQAGAAAEQGEMPLRPPVTGPAKRDGP